MARATETVPQDESPVPESLEALATSYASALLGSEPRLSRLADLRCWSRDAVEKLGVGLDRERVTFPIRNARGELVNLMRYAPDPARRSGPKMLALAGVCDECGETFATKRDADEHARRTGHRYSSLRRDLFPRPEDVESELVFVVEGEPDGVTGLSVGLPVVGIPGNAAFRDEWVERLAGRDLVFVYDCDAPSRGRVVETSRRFAEQARSVRIVDLDPSRDDGYDLTDLVRELGDFAVGVLRDLAAAAPVIVPDGVRLVSYDDVEDEDVDWLIPGLVPLGMLTLLGGEPGLNKSMLTVLWASLLSQAKLRGLDAGSTVFANDEDGRNIVRRRLEAAGADLVRVVSAAKTVDGFEETLVFPDDMPTLRRAIRDAGDVRLIVIDPLDAFVAEHLNTGVSAHIRRVLGPLARLADETGAAVVVVCHVKKGDSKDKTSFRDKSDHTLLRDIAGSFGGIPGSARSVLVMGPDGDDHDARLLRHIKSTNSRKAHPIALRVEEILLPPVNPNGPDRRAARLVQDIGRLATD